MKDFILIAKDATDEGAYERRMKVRPEHLEDVEKLRVHGNSLYGAALLDAEEKPCGSVMCLRFASRAELDKWLKTETYVINNVWGDIQILEARLAPPFNDLLHTSD